MEHIGGRIAALRKERGLTQEQLGRQVGVSAQAVSKWENGGAPDVELLPALADRLGVSIDTLFGRERREIEDMGALLGSWLRNLPPEGRLRSLHELLISQFHALGFPEIPGVLPRMTLLDSSAFRSNEDGSQCWLRSAFASDEGMVQAVPARDTPMFLLLPEPEGGYAAAFPDFGECRKLFSALSRPGALEAMGWFLGRKRDIYATAQAVARGLGRTTEEMEGVLEALAACHLLSTTSLETGEGTVAAYQNNDQDGLVPLLYFARWLLEKNEAWISRLQIRRAPVLREETEHES